MIGNKRTRGGKNTTKNRNERGRGHRRNTEAGSGRHMRSRSQQEEQDIHEGREEQKEWDQESSGAGNTE